MSKQIFSVADFAMILIMTNIEMDKRERNYVYTEERLYVSEKTYKKRLNSKEVQEALSRDQFYQDLLHLKKSLQNLNIEVETPKVEVRDEKES